MHEFMLKRSKFLRGSLCSAEGNQVVKPNAKIDKKQYVGLKVVKFWQVDGGSKMLCNFSAKVTVLQGIKRRIYESFLARKTFFSKKEMLQNSLVKEFRCTLTTWDVFQASDRIFKPADSSIILSSLTKLVDFCSIQWLCEKNGWR